jgi:hypothetical protein
MFRAWLAGCAAGEVLGFGATALVAAALIARFGLPATTTGRVVALAAMTSLGAIEGASLGWFQWHVLRRAAPRLPRRAWVGATTAIASGGWFLGMLVPLVVHLRTGSASSADGAGATRMALPAYLAAAAIFGGVAGLLFGGAQWLVLRDHVRRAGWWVPANAIGWAMGLPFAYLAGRLGDVAASPVTSLALALAAAAAMGIAVGLATGVCLHRLCGSRAP